MDKKKILKELVDRHKGKFNLSDVCFDKQVRFIEDPSKLKVAVCGRRAGKTYACAAYLLQIVLRIPNCKVVYLAITKDYARSLIWSTLSDINNQYSLGGKFLDSSSVATFPNGSEILVSGADTAAEVRKFRGHGLALVIVDEVQNFRTMVIEDLVENVLSKALYDYDGTLVLVGTPPPVPVGYFFDCDKGKMAGSFTHFKWNMFDNPHIKRKSGRTAEYLLQQDLKRKGVSINDPSIRREVFAEWATDTNALVFHYDYNINNYNTINNLTEYVIGVDIGFNDSDAIAVLGWSAAEPTIYLVEEYIKAGQTVTDLAVIVNSLIEKYKPLKVVMDTGGLGKKIAEEIRKRYSLPIEAAEKVRKFEFIELLNDALRTGKFKAQSTSQFAQDTLLVEWDRSKTQKLVIKDTFHSDIADAVLYAYREALHWLYSPPIAPIIKNTPEWYKAIEDQLEQEAVNRLSNSKDDQDEMNPWGKGIKPSDGGFE